MLVDDEPKLVDVVSAYLVQAGYEVSTALTGKAALEAALAHPPSLILLDLMLPDIPGEEVCRIIRTHSRVPILMLTAKSDESSLIQGFQLGADDYLTKPFGLKVLLARITALLRRARGEGDPLAETLSYGNGDLTVNTARRTVHRAGKEAILTPTEYNLLLAFLSNPHKVFTREDLIRIALGSDYDGSDRTIDSHIRNLRMKVEPDAADPRYILTVYGVGYRFGGSD